MADCISDGKFQRQIEHLTQYLPIEEELNGQHSGHSHYRSVKDRKFIDEHRIAYGHLTGLQDKYELTPSQKSKLTTTRARLVKRVEDAFVDCKTPPANLAEFLNKRRA